MEKHILKPINTKYDLKYTSVEFIKICGITDKEQARDISNLPITHIGVIHFPKSPRHIGIDKIKEIKDYINKSVKLVAVVVNPEKETVLKLLEVADVIQFHGDESLDFIKRFPKDRVIKAFRVKSKDDLPKMKPFFKEGYTILIDAYSKDAYGGTGKQINKELAKYIVEQYPKTVLSGGLSAENVKELIEYIKPYGVDASSKLEIKAGIKDIEKVKRFVNIVNSF